jgi:hypothetical protein
MLARRLILAILTVSFLAGCATSRNDKMKAMLDSYVGHTIADHVVAKGPPASVIDLAPNKSSFGGCGPAKLPVRWFPLAEP